MVDEFVIGYSLDEASRASKILKRLRTLLKRIYEARAYDEWSKGLIDVPTLVELQEEVKDGLESLMRDYSALLVAISNIEAVNYWKKQVLGCSSDLRFISEDDEEDLPEWGELLNRTIVRTGKWADSIETLLAERSRYDVFLSYSALNEGEAIELCKQLEKEGINVYFSKKVLAGGDNFSEEIRQALVRSTELWVLITPESLRSEWVTTEWGAGWALGKRVVPILLRCDVSQLPDRLRQLQCIDYHDFDVLIKQLVDRLGKSTADA
jgi:hypothetical protein